MDVLLHAPVELRRPTLCLLYTSLVSCLTPRPSALVGLCRTRVGGEGAIAPISPNGSSAINRTVTARQRAASPTAPFRFSTFRESSVPCRSATRSGFARSTGTSTATAAIRTVTWTCQKRTTGFPARCAAPFQSARTSTRCSAAADYSALPITNFGLRCRTLTTRGLYGSGSRATLPLSFNARCRSDSYSSSASFHGHCRRSTPSS